MVPFTITLGNLLARFLFPVPNTLCSGGRVALAPEKQGGGGYTKRHNDESTQLEVKVVTQPLDCLICQSQLADQGINVL